jgi:hypothetical protein
MVHACQPSYSGKCKIGRLWSRLNWTKSKTIFKITREKMAKGMAQVVQHLPSKCEALVQTPVLPKKKKKVLTERRRPIFLIVILIWLIGLTTKLVFKP